jgi:hypothetical protein
VLTLTPAQLAATTAGEYVLQVNVTTILNQSTTATWSFKVADPGAPSVTVDAPGALNGSITVQATRGIRLSSTLRADSVCSDSSVGHTCCSCVWLWKHACLTAAAGAAESC